MKSEIPYYEDFLSPLFLKYLKEKSRPVEGIADLSQVGEGGGYESVEALKFICEIYELVKHDLNKVLLQREIDRKFIDERTKALYDYNKTLKIDFTSPEYKTVIGLEDAKGRVVVGPLDEYYCKSGKGKMIAPLPKYLEGPHVTLFGPPDNAKLSINAMNAYHRKLKNEPPIIAELLSTHESVPKWGADDEDSKTPMRKDLISAGENLSLCFEKRLEYLEKESGKKYQLENHKLSQPIKRFPGLALPSFSLFYKENPIPLHIYDFALHLYQNWHNLTALSFYVPKLENEEEAKYLKLMIESAERLIQKNHPQYLMGSIRLMIVLENPRAILRTNEIMDELYPYFAGASLGWHDYLASTARLFKEDANYRIPVKADPNIVLKYIKASHLLLADVVGSRGGIKVGGMYGVLPVDPEIFSPSFQITLKGLFKDVIVQLKRNLTGFWMSHPDFIRIGLSLVEAWRFFKQGDESKIEKLVSSLLIKDHHQEIMSFIRESDVVDLDTSDLRYVRTLLVADLKESNFIANNHADEIRYNIFQSLQYLTDWLSGNGCVALPATINNTAVRVMDDLATAERSRWEVWHELYHQRFSIHEFLKIAHEELHFIRKDLSNDKKIVQVKWNNQNEKWYPVAFNLMIILMTSKRPVEFATQLLLPFTIDTIRNSLDPWNEVLKIDKDKFQIDPMIIRFNYYFERCGSLTFAKINSQGILLSKEKIKESIMSFSKDDILDASWFHGDIGENKKTLDAMASGEQAKVIGAKTTDKEELQNLGKEYFKKFSMKFLISAKDKTAEEILKQMKMRLNNSEEIEIENAKSQLLEITLKRMESHPLNDLSEKINRISKKHQIQGATLAIINNFHIDELHLGFRDIEKNKVDENSLFQIASLSKTLASAFAIEYFYKKNISLDTSVNDLLKNTKSSFRLKSKIESNITWADEVKIKDLLSHSALNLHYVNGISPDQKMPNVSELLNGNNKYSYRPVEVINEPGKKFQYSGGGFLVLEHLIESLEEKKISEITKKFLSELNMNNFSFSHIPRTKNDFAQGFRKNNKKEEFPRLNFPAFAAGAVSSAADFAHFLNCLAKAYVDLNGCGPISHDTAAMMMFGQDKGCQKFMGCKMGLGVFICEAMENRFIVHQGANDGFRAIFIHCYKGPNQGSGFVILCRGELEAILFNAEVAQEIIQTLNWKGINYNNFKTNFSAQEIPKDEVVNIGYKNLIFDAFIPDLPEKIESVGPRDPLAQFNLLTDAKIIEVSNQMFARVENLISSYLPTFDPELFGKQGKIMDSWETVRHNRAEFDYAVFELKNASALNYIYLSTEFHLGNQAPFVEILGQQDINSEWILVLNKTTMEGHSFRKIKLIKETLKFKRIKIHIYPDGGLSRVGLFKEVSDIEKKKFVTADLSKCSMHSTTILQTLKPLSIPYNPTAFEITRNLKNAKSRNNILNIASRAFGAEVVSASNQHYSPATLAISPFPPLNMFDGFESSRSRAPNHFEELVIKLCEFSAISKIEIDFTYFVNNNPQEIEILGMHDEKNEVIVEKCWVKPFAGNVKIFKISSKTVFSQIKIRTYPDGGLNRIKVYNL